MTFIQKLIMRTLPKSWSATMKAESEQWIIRCPECDFHRSVWDIGGVRYKAASVGKKLRIRCPQCGDFRWMSLQFEPDKHRFK